MSRARVWLGCFACALGCGLFPSLDDLRATKLASDAGPWEDAQPGDGGSPDGFCSAAPSNTRFCDDFDTVDLAARWDNLVVDPASTLTRVDGGVTESPPFALYAKSIGNGPNAYVSKAIAGGPWHHLEVSFWMHVDAVGNNSYRNIVVLQLEDGSSSAHTLSFVLHMDSAAVVESFTAPDGGASTSAWPNLFAYPQLGSSTNVRLVMDPPQTTAAGGTLVVKLGGTTVGTYTNLQPWTRTPLVLRVGIANVFDIYDPWIVRLDDVQVQGD